MQTQTKDRSAATLRFFGPRPTTHETSCISIIWLKDRFPRHLKNAFLIEVKKNQGVRSARFSLNEPSLLIVTYDVMLTKPLDILGTVKALGADARLVGC